MNRVLLLGVGKIGSSIAKLLAACGDYEISLGDANPAAVARFADFANVTVLKFDILSEREFQRAMQGAKSCYFRVPIRYKLQDC